MSEKLIRGSQSTVIVTGIANWCYVCGVETKPATAIVLDLGYLNPDFPKILVEIHELGETEGSLADRILQAINVRLPEIGGYVLEKRKPKVSRATYLGNTCTGCGAFLSRSYIPHRSPEDRTLMEFDLATTAEEVEPFYKIIDRWCFIDRENPPSKTLLAMHGFPVSTTSYRSHCRPLHSRRTPHSKRFETLVRRTSDAEHQPVRVDAIILGSPSRRLGEQRKFRPAIRQLLPDDASFNERSCTAED